MNTFPSYKKTAPLAEDIRAALAALKGVRSTMNLTTLTTEERVEYQKDRVNRIALSLLEDRLLAARESRDLLPVSFDLRRFERDTQLTLTLQDCLCFIEELRTAVKDTLLVVKSCAAQAALVADGHLKVASGPGQNLKWAVRKLSHRNGRARQAAPAAPAPPPRALLTMPTPVPVALPAPTPGDERPAERECN